MKAEKATTGVILAGGKSSRFGTNKALSLFRGERLIERLACALRQVTDHMLMVTNTPEEYAFLGLPMIPDSRPGCGPLGGLYTGLDAMETETGIFIACDMPFVRPDFLRYMLDLSSDYDVVVPQSAEGDEPLCAVYRRSCVPAIEKRLDAGRFRMIAFYDEVRVRRVKPEDTPLFDPETLFNVNTREDYEAALRRLEPE